MPHARAHHRPALVVLSLLLTLVATPARAFPTVVITEGLPPGWVWWDAETPTVGVAGPGTPPLGTGSLRVPGGQSLLKNIEATPAGMVLAYSGHARSPVTGSAVAHVTVRFPSTPMHHKLWLPLEGAGAWRSFDLLTSDDITVMLPTGTFLDAQGDGVPDTFTWDSYRAAYPQAHVHGVSVAFMKGSDYRELFYLDGLTFATTGTPTTYDLEPGPEWPLRTSVSHATVAYGTAVYVKGILKDDISTPVEGTVLELYSKAWGDDTFSLAGPVSVTDGDGRVFAQMTPRRQTQYQWRVSEIRDQDLAKNFVLRTPVAVDVRRLITADVADTTIKTADPMVVTGKTTPNAEGASVALWREGGSNPLMLGAVRSDGTYRLAKKLPAGTWKVYTTVAANAGMLKGTSPKTSVTVQ